MPTGTASRTAAVVPRRLSFQFSADGEYAACVLAGASARPLVEAWSLAGPRARSRLMPVDGVPVDGTQLVPCADGRVLALLNGHAGHRLNVLSPHGSRPVGELPGEALRGLPSRDPEVLAWLLSCEDGERTTLFAVEPTGLACREVAGFAGRVAGPVWWDAAGCSLTATVVNAGGRRVVRVDAPSGNARVDRWPVVPLAVSPHGTVLGTATGPRGTVVGWFDPGGTSLRCPPGLNGLAGCLRPLAFDPTGTRLALRVTEGARSRLLIGEAGSDDLREVTLPPGVIRAAGWGRRGLHLVFTTPADPATVATVDGEGRLAPLSPRVGAGPTAALKSFPGPAGPIEAVCYGDHRTARTVVLALHGGPEGAWEFAWEPVLRACADAGIAVVAPNQRGSIGYGPAHRHAADGAWGGPDLEDVLHLGRAIAGERDGRPAALLGTSYGAFLALLAAAAEPGGWTRCAALAPFLSAERLHADANEQVRAMIDRLKGRTAITDALGTRDLDILAARVEVPVFCAHGGHDEVIPAAHSRRIVERLLGSGRLRPADVRYREPAGAGHDPLDGPGGAALTAELVAFLDGSA
ncbi:alpha/beta hydrolase family protein [Phytomonospora endophytica]|uniref:Alpha-beta hydrolase superfamily lysophospholipase n=1 Tax=Phytomonospora endophytica TaxID=714109 RepID=A0A841FK98_9ACTN|nr:alpha/beta fold hydrolase [Phytomonospora endophytica]MBB6033577.1 alpha-beta hydrolase superfamily lysophospholipase [Phytomonospora endophytica]